jgi:hypothetical protein
VHLIDREGDIRRWETVGSHGLVRVKDNPKVDYEGEPMACKALAQELAFIKTRRRLSRQLLLRRLEAPTVGALPPA